MYLIPFRQSHVVKRAYDNYVYGVSVNDISVDDILVCDISRAGFSCRGLDCSFIGLPGLNKLYETAQVVTLQFSSVVQSQDLPNPQDIRREASYPAMFFRSKKAKRMWVNHN